jgi:hypothetical protein
MIRLSRFFEVPFDDPAISVAELLAFATDHLQRMIANNPGNALAVRINATQIALALVLSMVTDDDTKVAIRKSRKKAKDAFRKGLAARIARIAGAVTAKYGADSTEMTECFPQGRNIFNTARDDGLGNSLQTLINGVTAYQSGLGAQVVADATALLTEWNVVYSASETAGGATTATQGEKNAARLSLQGELFQNLVTLAGMFPRQPEKAGLYMQQSLLGEPTQEDGGNPPVG